MAAQRVYNSTDTYSVPKCVSLFLTLLHDFFLLYNRDSSAENDVNDLLPPQGSMAREFTCHSAATRFKWVAENFELEVCS